MKVVSNASPLITLARIGHLDSLHKLYDLIHISTEVYNEVVIAGAGMDEWKGRLAVEEGLTVVGCAGILEELFRRGEILDLR